MFRSPWFWITAALIAAGIALTVALGALYWLIGAFVVAALTLVIAFLVAAYSVGQTEPPQLPRLRKVPKSERISVIYDCDLTMGRPFRDVGDGLALLYILGEPRLYLRFVSTTYGNGPVKMTTRTTSRLLNRLAFDDVAVIGGAAGPDDDPETNRAARYLKNIVGDAPGKITLIATGSLTNLKHAAALDPGFFKKLRGLYLFGGTTGPLTWNGHRLADRNFSLDPEAAYQAIHADCPVTVITGEVGLGAVFRGPQFAALQVWDDPVSRLIARQTRLWFALTRFWFRDGGFGMWDSSAVLALTYPELFECEQVHVASTRDDLHTGQLFVDPDGRGPVRLVRGIKDSDRFITIHFAAWRRLWRRVSGRRRSRNK